MGKVFRCKDFGGQCNWICRAETREEILRKIAKDGVIRHNMKEMSENMKVRIMAAVRDVK